MTLTSKQLLEIQGTDPRYVTSDQLRWLTGSQIRWLTGSQIRCLTGSQLRCLTGSQLRCLTGSQLRCLTESQIRWLTESQIRWLTESQRDLIGLKNVPILENPYTKILAAVKGGENLEMKSWHTCETTHCVGGWTVCLTPKGREFEAKHGTALAAELILRASRPDAPLPNFTASNEAAMAFIEARAKEEAQAA